MENAYRRGARKEYKILKRAREMGMLAFRSAGSHSPIDIFAMDVKEKKIYLIQSKGASLSSAARERLLNDLKKYEGVFEVHVRVE